MGLVVSGGHTDLVRVRGFGDYQVLGRTRDDAAGECFDKVANLLGLGYPGGPLIDQFARKGDPRRVSFPRPYLTGSWDFSFSGLKTAVLYHLKKFPAESLKPQEIWDLCASFQSAMVDVLAAKTVQAAKKFKLKKVSVGGGVSANSYLRERFLQEGKKNRLQIFLPSKKFCTDNAAMVAALGYHRLRKSFSSKSRRKQVWNLAPIDPALPIQNWK